MSEGYKPALWPGRKGQCSPENHFERFTTEGSLECVKMRVTMVLAVLGLWLGAANHCLLEAMPGFTFLVCAPHGEEAPHQDRDCSTDSCATVEKGGYKTEKAVGKVSSPILVLVAVLPSLSVDALQDVLAVQQQPDSTAERSVRWRFSSRAALPPRAPSFLA